MESHTEDFRQILRSELAERCNRNPMYSLRAFARDLKLEPARLSDVLNGKKGFSRSAAQSIGKLLGYTDDEILYFSDLVESEHGRSELSRQLARRRIELHQSQQAGKTLSLDAVKIISEWHHFAILELMKLPGFVSDSDWIAGALGLKAIQVQDALQRLERVNLVENVQGNYRASQNYVFAPDGVPSDAVKKLHEQLLGKAVSALYLQPVDQRDFSAMLMPIASEDIPEIRKQIRKFTKKISADYADEKRANRVYCLSLQYFNLTEKLQDKDTISK